MYFPVTADSGLGIELLFSMHLAKLWISSSFKYTKQAYLSAPASRRSAAVPRWSLEDAISKQ